MNVHAASTLETPRRLVLTAPRILSAPGSALDGSSRGRAPHRMLLAQADAPAGATATDATAAPAATPVSAQTATVATDPTVVTSAVVAPTRSTTSVSVEAQDRHLHSMLVAHRSLEVATSLSLAMTGFLGVVNAYNQATVFGPGACASGNPVFGNYGCQSLNVVHGISAVTSLALYTMTDVIELAAPRPGVVTVTGGWHAARRVAQVIHIVGMIVMPVLGMVSAYPEIIGINNQGSRFEFQRDMRTIHAGVGVLTAGAYLTQVAIDLGNP